MNTRTIKFRAFHKIWRNEESSGMNLVKGLWWGKSGIGHVHLIEWADSCLLSDVELMQYTGLKDKEGVAIFEGDVVQCDVRIEGRLFKKARGEVVYADNVAAFCVNLDDDYGSLRTGPSTDGSSYALPMEQLRDFVVLGNVHENPDLLIP